MDHQQLKSHLDERFDRLESKLDIHDEKFTNHLERLSKAEETIIWLKGHVKIVTAIGISIAGFIAAALFNLITKNKGM